MTRNATRRRTTRETDVSVSLDLAGAGTVEIDTGVGFLDHLLTSLAYHAMWDLSVSVSGDLHVDDHHTVEDTFLVLGEAFAEAIGNRAGIVRFGDAVVPMDEAIGSVAVDIGGRPYAVIEVEFGADRIGALSTQMIPHGLEALARTAGVTLHATGSGGNDHHIAEALFKALGRAMRTAAQSDPGRMGIPSTKGTA